MSDLTSKTEYIVKYFMKDGSIKTSSNSNYGSLLYEASNTFSNNKDSIDSYEILETTTITKVIMTRLDSLMKV